MIIRGTLFFAAIFFSFCNSKTEAGIVIKENSKKSPADSISGIETDSSKIDTIALGINFKEGNNYNQVKLASTNLKRQIKDSSFQKKKEVFEEYILNEIIPYWYKTPWDFNGYTDVPKKGVVACGYFVSTVLKHAGCNLNRFTLAQQNPLNEAKTIALGDSVEVYEMNTQQLQQFFNESKKEGLYFVGLDFHVGFLLFRNKELYFIHSNYINAEGVIFEKALYSEAFNSTSSFRISSISTNPNFINRWIKSAAINTVTK